jgi:hypothetical protein
MVNTYVLSGYLLQNVLTLKIYQLRISFQPLWSGNRKGLSGPLKGGAMHSRLLGNPLEFYVSDIKDKKLFNKNENQTQCALLSRYEMVRITESRLESIGNKRGLFSYLLNEVKLLQIRHYSSKRLC